MNVLYIGSFCPYTHGHNDIVNRALRYNYGAGTELEKLYICVGNNEEKESIFSLEERRIMIEEALKDHPERHRIEVIADNGITADIAQRLNINTLIRGIRAAQHEDEEEHLLAHSNKRLAKIRGFELNTTFIYSHDEFLGSISSTKVRTLYSLGEYIEASKLVPHNIHQHMMGYYIKNNLLSDYIEPHKLSELWRPIAGIYAKRCYHNLTHLGHMFNMLNIYKYQTGYIPSSSFVLAVIGHDLVIDNTMPNNELESYNKLMEMCDNCKLLPYDENKIKKLIMATNHSLPLENPTHEEELIADLDLSILGTFSDHSWNKVYCDGIRNENINIPTAEFNTKRIEFLKELLARERIFKTDVFYKLYEERARINIAQELEKLQA